MATREAACHCGQLRLEIEGDPFVVGICNCLACQRRTGSAFGMQAAFEPSQVQTLGRYSTYRRISDEADRKPHDFHFCPECGSQVFYTEPDEPDLVVVSVGSFADPAFPPPTEEGYASRRHHWLTEPPTVEQDPGSVAWASIHPLYEAGAYAEAAERGRDVLEEVPHPRVFYNVACCESLAGQTDEAIEHLRQAIELWEGCRELARGEADFDALRDAPAFQALVDR